MKVCHVFELKKPTPDQIQQMIQSYGIQEVTPDIIDFIQGDMRKMEFIFDIYKSNMPVSKILNTIFQKKLFNEDVKNITRQLLSHHAKISDHDSHMNETDRTIIALLWHENIVDCLHPVHESLDIYLRILDNIRYADYIDRITFQHQIWQFNEMSSLMKTFHCNKMYHDEYPTNKYEPDEIRFTKVLTKYSTEYNNQIFIQSLCYELNMEKKDVISFFEEMRGSDMTVLEKELKSCNISKLDIRRMYRYLDKNVKKEEEDAATITHTMEDEDDDEDDSEDAL